MMKKNSFDGANPIAEVENKLMKSFDILRGLLGADEYYILLYLLILKRDGVIDELALKHSNSSGLDLINAIHKYASRSNEDHEIWRLNRVFEPIVNLLTDSAVLDLIMFFDSIDQKILGANFPAIFDNLLYTIAKSQGKFGGEFSQPAEITRIICRLANINQSTKVFNPFAGLASFDVLSNVDHNYFGQELSHKVWILGTLRLLAYNKLNTTKYLNEDSIENWPLDDQKFDLIVSNPPFGVNLRNHYKWQYPEIKTTEQFLIEKGISSLNNRGKLIAVLSNGFLFREGAEQRLRERLIESDLIETIISLPGGLLMNTGIPIIILVINKDKSLQDKVRIIDAQRYTISRGKREIILNDDALSSVLNIDTDSESVRIVSKNQIRELDYNLNTPRYFQKEFEGVMLSEILDSVRVNRNSLPENGMLIKIRDLKDDKLPYVLDVKTVEEVPLSRSGIRRIDESCLLLAMRWRTLKPTYFQYEGTSIYLNQDILSFNVNETVVNMAYLVNELNADYVQEQLDAYRMGGTIPFIRRDDLLKVKIKLPSINEQIAKIQGIEELSNKINVLRKERNAIAHGQSNSQFNEFASLKHTLGRPRQNILDWSDNLLDFLASKENELATINREFAEFYDIDILTALKEIKKDINFISEVLEKGEDGFVITKGKYPKSLVSLTEVKSIINELSSNGYNFRIKKTPYKGENLKNRGIECNITLLKILIDNLFTNANKHAFSKQETNNEVVVELLEVQGFLELEIKNNGKPFPKNIDKEKFIIKYSTSNSIEGSGLGGYDINRIAEYFENPDWELILNEDPIYKVRFKFRFPIKLIK